MTSERARFAGSAPAGNRCALRGLVRTPLYRVFSGREASRNNSF